MNRNNYLLKTYIELQSQFISNRNDRFWDYLKRRGITELVANKYELGYNNRFFDIKDKKEPLIGKDAITIPFRDMDGRIIAFQSRFIKNPTIHGVEYRYFNSEVIPFVYEKRKYIYNLNNVLKQGYSRELYIVEGVFDLYSLVVQGIFNVVAVIGNKLTTEIVEMLRRYFDTLIFILDAGKEGSDILRSKNRRLYDLDIYKIQVGDIGDIKIKDSNDLLVGGWDIQQYINEHKVIVDKVNIIKEMDDVKNGKTRGACPE
jgi:DNA primase